MKIPLTLSWLLFVVLLASYLSHNATSLLLEKVPCYFIFGDSLADNGNNNPLQTTAKVNYTPYGIDFPYGPTGRFTNGRTTPDLIGQLLGFLNFTPPFTTAQGNAILKGVNYASGAAGIRDETGQAAGERISLNEQLRNHEITISRIAQIQSNPNATRSLLNKCVYSIGMGSNDYINNYFMPQFYNTSTLFTPDQYAQALIVQYSTQLTTLYNDGARKFVLYGIGSIGCTPAAIAIYGTNGSLCVDALNNAALLFNTRLKSLVDQFNGNLAGAKFIYVNTTQITSNFAQIFPNIQCCQSNEFGLCVPLSTPCQNRVTYLFWDAFHPTEAANILTAFPAYSSLDQSNVYPMNILQLALL